MSHYLFAKYNPSSCKVSRVSTYSFAGSPVSIPFPYFPCPTLRLSGNYHLLCRHSLLGHLPNPSCTLSTSCCPYLLHLFKSQSWNNNPSDPIWSLKLLVAIVKEKMCACETRKRGEGTTTEVDRATQTQGWGEHMARLGNFSVYTQLLSSVQLLSMLWTVAPQAPLSMGFSRHEYWKGLPCPSPGDLPDPVIEPVSPAWADRFLPLSQGNCRPANKAGAQGARQGERGSRPEYSSLPGHRELLDWNLERSLDFISRRWELLKGFK